MKVTVVLVAQHFVEFALFSNKAPLVRICLFSFNRELIYFYLSTKSKSTANTWKKGRALVCVYSFFSFLFLFLFLSSLVLLCVCIALVEFAVLCVCIGNIEFVLFFPQGNQSLLPKKGRRLYSCA